MDAKARIKGNIATYLALTVLFCLVPYYWCIHSGNVGGGFGSVSLASLLMWAPALAALATCRLRHIPLDELGWNWRPAKYQWMAYGIPILYIVVEYIVIWLTGIGGFYNKELVSEIAKGCGWSMPDGIVIVLYVLLAGTFGMARSLSTALGEEIGWRGFLTPQLAKLNSYTATSLWMGFIWSLFHYPVLLFGNYNSGGPKWISLLCFTTSVVAICFVMTWLRLKSGSLWTGAILHASHNLFIQEIFTPLTVDTGHTSLYIDEFGVGLPIVTVALAIYFWRRRHELPNMRI